MSSNSSVNRSKFILVAIYFNVISTIFIAADLSFTYMNLDFYITSIIYFILQKMAITSNIKLSQTFVKFNTTSFE